MPCKDTGSLLTLTLDSQDRLLDFEFGKITCRKEIGQSDELKKHWVGMDALSLFECEFLDQIESMGIDETEDQFFVYLALDAIQAGIASYLGLESGFAPKHHEIISIVHGEDRTEIQIEVLAPLEQPKVLSCFVRQKQKT